jgi:hypothetical protein
MTVLTACGSTIGASTGPTPIPYIAPPTPSASPSASPIPASPPPAAALPPVAAAPAAAPPAPTVRSAAFPLLAIGGSRVSGQVQVTERDGAFVAGVSVRGLAAGTATLHAVHIHAGSCANPYGGIHLTVLGLLRTDPTGMGMLTAGLAPVYVANGRYVIVYSTTAPQVIVACANLMSLS